MPLAGVHDLGHGVLVRQGETGNLTVIGYHTDGRIPHTTRWFLVIDPEWYN